MSGNLLLMSGVLIAALAVGFAATSFQSLWIDEAHSAYKAMQHSFADFRACMLEDFGSDLQMPLYMVMLWGWEKVFGHSEFALRAMNIPLFVLALLAAAVAWRTTGTQRVFFVVFACSSAFVWAYLDEARPYILQFLGATACAIPLANAAGASAGPRSSDIGFFVAGVIILCGSSLLGVVASFWFSTAFLLLWLMQQPLTVILKRTDLRLVFILSFPVLLLLAVYYLWTLSLGAGASSVGSTNILSITYASYELLGMAGLGPGRGELRSSSLAMLAFTPYLIAYATAVGAMICVGVIIGARHSYHPTDQKGLVIFWMAPIAAAVTTLIVGIVGDFRVVGRHLTPLLPFLLILFSQVASASWWAGNYMAGRSISILAMLAMLASAIAYRTSERHSKDDYRSAAAFAHETLTRGGTVWWAADPAGANYYGLNPSPADTAANNTDQPVVLASNVTAIQASNLPHPELVILSKTDIYDSRGSLQAWLSQNKYALRYTAKAFQIFESPAPHEH